MDSSTGPAPSPAAQLKLFLEALAPIAIAQGYIWLVPHGRPRWQDVACGVVIGTFLIFGIWRHGPRTWREFGLAWGRDHARAALPVLAITGIALAVLLVGGWWTGRLRQNADFWRALWSYPFWGLAQQGLMFAFVYPRLKQSAGARLAAPLTAALFAAAHLPNPLLVAGGGLVVLGFALVWERAPSLPLLALSHGILGAVCDKALHVSMRVGAHYLDTT